jgi:hypothetical protein
MLCAHVASGMKMSVALWADLLRASLHIREVYPRRQTSAPVQSGAPDSLAIESQGETYLVQGGAPPNVLVHMA